MERTTQRTPPTGIQRLFWRAPVQLYRLGLGRLLGHRLLLLHHQGRRSGLERTAVIEVVERDDDAPSWTIVSGFGPTADWYRNLRAHPQVRVETAGREHEVTATFLDPEATAAVMTRYAHAHPKAATTLSAFLGYRVDGSDADWAAVGREMPCVRLVGR
jgi:deazaflavin-dependent oxidoreductase (nitroreductase family)